MESITSTSEVRRISPDGSGFIVAAGATAVTSSAIDTAGYDHVTIMLSMGTIVSGAVTSAKVQQCDTSGGSYADLEGTAQTIADTDDNKVVVWEINRPREFFLKVVTSRATQNATIDGLHVILSRARKQPVTQGSTILTPELFNSPPEGTA